ncbi:MAG: ISAzo13 family transposase [Cytophagales bacterium]|nr:MAG: ISAzo13 family transposase [Cytophagales bacterium]
MASDSLLSEKYTLLLPHLNESSKRLYLASEAMSIGRGGISKVSKLTSVSRVTLTAGLKELRSKPALTSSKNGIRQSGGGRKKATDLDKNLIEALKKLVAPHTVGEGFSLQANKKTNEGGNHPDRDAQFQHINNTSAQFIANGEAVISVDCKKKELIGEFKNSGTEWTLKDNATAVNVYDFVDKDLGKAVPYGVYDIERNQGWVSVGINYDTAKFAVSSIRNWWHEMGMHVYQESKRIYINADGGGSNSSRSRLWKTELQLLANELNKEIHVSHFPPGTSKWNKIEHKMFSFISMNWRANPLVSLQVIVNLIAATTTTKGLKINAKADTTPYEKGIKVSDEELLLVNVTIG